MRARSLVLVLALLSACREERSSQSATSRDVVAEPPPPTHVAEILPAPRDVTFRTSDGVTIGATLARAVSPDAPAVILVHQVGSTRAEWAPLLERLRVQRAFTTLAIDLRGHGASTEGPAGPLDWRTFDDAQWASTRLDVLAAVAFLSASDSGVDPAALAAIGSSIGSSAVVAAAAEEPRLTALVTLSPGRAYHGFEAITPALALADRAVFAVVAHDETDSVDTAETYGRITHVPAMVVDGSAHGVVLLTNGASVLDRVEDFLRQQLAWARVVDRPAGPRIAAPAATSTGTPTSTR